MNGRFGMATQRRRGEPEEIDLLDEEEQERLCNELRKEVEADTEKWGKVLAALGVALAIVQVAVKAVFAPVLLPGKLVFISGSGFIITGLTAVVGMREWVESKADSNLRLIILAAKIWNLAPPILALYAGLDLEVLLLYCINPGYVALVWYAASMSVGNEKDLLKLEKLRYGLKSA